MISNFVRSIGGIGAFGVLSICLFFTVFSGALLWSCLLRKSFLKRMESLPLHDGETEAKGNNHE
jgi:hypothetical protein